MSIVTVILKGDDRSYRKKFLAYEPFKADAEDPFLSAVVEEAKAEFQPEDGEDLEIQIKIVMTW